MPIDKDRKRELADTASQLLEALAAVATSVRQRITGRPPNRPGHVIAGGTNLMVDGNAAPRRVGAIVDNDFSNLERISREPFIARVQVEWTADGKEEVLFVTRASAAGLTDIHPDGRLVTYAAALGRLAEIEAGDLATIMVAGERREAKILERVQLRPEQAQDQWDGLDNTLEFSEWHVSVASLRSALAQLRPIPAATDLVAALRRRAEEQELARQTGRRRIIARISLRDQPILDRYQGEIFRLPLSEQLVLLGPPGTGKTTTLIKRLAQKLKHDALTEEEKELLFRAGLEDTFYRGDGWAMFAPTELLSLYLHAAFSREGVPARPENLRTWEKERLELGRNVFAILRSAERGVFQLEEGVEALQDASSNGISRAYDEFSSHFETTLLEHTHSAIRELEGSVDPGVSAAIAGLRRVLGSEARSRPSTRSLVRLVGSASELLQPEIRRLDDEISREVDRLANRLLSANPRLVEEVNETVQDETVEATSDDEEDDEEESERPSANRDSELRALEILSASIRTSARATALGRSRIGGRTRRIIDILDDQWVPANDLAGLGQLLLNRGRLRAIRDAPRRYVMGIPRVYREFRRDPTRQGTLFQSSVRDLVRTNRITPAETDVLILTALRNARVLIAGSSSDRPEWLNAVAAHYLPQVFVDEATDFSAVQLACTLELSHPNTRSWFACGDLLQRITSYGLQSEAELKWIGGDAWPIEVRKVKVGYRQAKRLRSLAAALAGGEDQVGQPPPREEDTDVYPLLVEHAVGEGLGQWLATRIIEVEKAIGRLPSIAIFVDGDHRIDAVVAHTRPYLAQRNVTIIGCKEGRVVGDAQEVRVFDVRHIKGLEFEAVFFVDVDQLAERLPSLFDRYLYVAITRAATYLGVSCETVLPSKLEPYRSYFADAKSYPW